MASSGDRRRGPLTTSWIDFSLGWSQRQTSDERRFLDSILAGALQRGGDRIHLQ